jgi:hypothetical protein
MAVEEFARLYYAMSRILEDASDSLQLSKRAGIVLWLLSESDKNELDNQSLVRNFGLWQVSTSRDGASRDVSLANGELANRGWIVIKRGPYRVVLTSDGIKAAEAFLAHVADAVRQLPPPLRDLLGHALGTSSRKEPTPEGGGLSKSGRPGRRKDKGA